MNSALDQTPATARAGAQQVTWCSPVEGLWVAETPSYYLGMVDSSGDGFVATGATGHHVGVFPTLEDAQVAIHARWFVGEGQSVSARWALRGSRSPRWQSRVRRPSST